MSSSIGTGRKVFRRLTPDEHRKIHNLVSQGIEVKYIAERFNVSTTTVRSALAVSIEGRETLGAREVSSKI